MFPKRLQQNPRVLALTLAITFISGANFFAVLMFWPTQAYNMYGHDPIGVGVRGLPIGFAVMVGGVACLIALTMTGGKIRLLMIVSTILMTLGTGLMALARPDNIGPVIVILIVAGLGIGGILVPASIITTIICPDDLIATVSALTLSIRVLGGAVGVSSCKHGVFIAWLTKMPSTLSTTMCSSTSLSTSLWSTLHVSHRILHGITNYSADAKLQLPLS